MNRYVQNKQKGNKTKTKSMKPKLLKTLNMNWKTGRKVSTGRKLLNINQLMRKLVFLTQHY